MLDKEKPDLVAICNAGGPPRVEVILEATRRGLPWIAEKPLANDRAGLDRVRAALKKNPVPFSMLLPMRFDPSYRALHDLARSGQLGEIGQISSQKSYKSGDRPEWMRNPVTYGGTIAWIGIHMIDLMRYTSGREFVEAFSFQSQVAAPAGIGRMENTTGTVFRMDNGGVATLHMDYYRPDSAVTHGDDRLRLAGSKGVAEYMEATGVTLIAEGRKPERLTNLPPRGSVFLDFVESLYLGRKSDLTSGSIFRNCEATIAAQESARLGRPVKIA
jgi:predicted dehydrogenase